MIQELSTCIEKPWIENDDVVATPVLSDWVKKPTPGVQPMRPTLTLSRIFPPFAIHKKCFLECSLVPRSAIYICDKTVQNDQQLENQRLYCAWYTK